MAIHSPADHLNSWDTSADTSCNIDPFNTDVLLRGPTLIIFFFILIHCVLTGKFTIYKKNFSVTLVHFSNHP